MKYEAGYPGEDSMRSKAERMFRSEMAGSGIKKPVPQSMSSKGNTNMRPFARGGSTVPRHHMAKHHNLSHDQSDMHIPRRAATPPLNVERFSEVEHMKHGGHAHHRRHRAEGGDMEARATGGAMRRGGHAHKGRHYDLGGFVKGIGEDIFNTPSAIGNGIKHLFGFAEGGDAKRRGGSTHRKHKADGGSCVMNGEHPVGKEGAMRRGGHAHHRRHAEGGDVEARATGGCMKHGGRSKHRFGYGGTANQAPVATDYSDLPPRAQSNIPNAPAMNAGANYAPPAGAGNRPFEDAAGIADISRRWANVPAPNLHPGDNEDMGIGNMHQMNARRGGRAHHHRGHHAHHQRRAGGGSIYEREMVGEHPSRTPHHFNYEADMRGEHGHFEKPQRLAAGGVGKMRHGVANAKGFPIKTHKVKKGY